ncbi:ABC transporter ATP-binding protein [Paenibacillus bouchesdurhonensis]|uniref:ABC transporter ATP-binding protein n=1 Tax=Paenibacillus bouchesdurhonensis TaxID=1870990 RepID=UPI000DA63D63|nr:ATP-binding cassette domain-containing protein [Paenibacillus bouchesdurhonensis]
MIYINFHGKRGASILPKLLEFEQLKKSHANSSETLLFNKVSAALACHDRIALLGTSGQGKSTLLRILSLLDIADEGDIRLEGVSSKQFDPIEWRMKICYVAQQAVMLPGSVEDNLRTVHQLHHIPYDVQLVNKLLSQAGLEAIDLNKNAADLSGGEKQRIALIRSLLLRPKILLLDEITASLDQSNANRVENMLQEWHRKEGTSIIWVTHQLEQAARISDYVWFMDNHTLLERTSTDQFFEQPETELARRYLQQPADRGALCLS